MDLRNHAFMVQTVRFSKVQISEILTLVYYVPGIKKGLMKKKKIMWTEKTPIVYIKNKTVVYLTLL